MAFRGENFLAHSDGSRQLGLVVHGGFDHDIRRLLVRLRRMQEDAPVGDVDWPGFFQADMAVNAAARIPARGFGRVVEADGDDVRRAVELHEARDLDAERAVAVGPLARELAVHINFRARHRAVEIEEDPAAPVGLAERECLAIPADPGPRELARVVGQVGAERAFDPPVVRRVHQPPGRIIERGIFEPRRLVLRAAIGHRAETGEPPARIERFDGACFCRGGLARLLGVLLGRGGEVGRHEEKECGESWDGEIHDSAGCFPFLSSGFALAS